MKVHSKEINSCKNWLRIWKAYLMRIKRSYRKC